MERERIAVGGRRTRRAAISRRRALARILASATFILAGRHAYAQKALVTPPGTGAPPRTRNAELPLARDLADDAAASARGRLPILLFFDRVECAYCERALREYLVPMSREEWKDRALFRQVEIDLPSPLVDFDGVATTHRALAARYGVTLSPTVIVVDAKGAVLASPIVGLTTVDFYGAYLENALEEALRKLAC